MATIWTDETKGGATTWNNEGRTYPNVYGYGLYGISVYGVTPGGGVWVDETVSPVSTWVKENKTS